MQPIRPLWVPWSSPDPSDDSVQQRLASEFGLPPLVACILAQRGLGDPLAARRFLEPTFAELIDPAALRDVDAAVTVLAQAIARGETVALHGDYDADGISATALFASFLEAVSGPERVHAFLPVRGLDGYGLSERGVREAAAAGARVLVALDCGTSDGERVALARELGMAPVIIDHHPASGELPAAAAAVCNPARSDCGFAGGTLAATGVAFFVLMALRRRLRQDGWFAPPGRSEPNLARLLDLVTLGTVGDMVPLTGQNRILVRHGLRELSLRARPGIDALCGVANLGRVIDEGDVGFKLTPRLNAAGRLTTPRTGYDLLLARAGGEAERLAQALEEQNLSRRQIQAQVEAEALEQVEQTGQAAGEVLVVAKEGWHPGVVGVVASRLAERYYLPAVVIALREGLGLGSARSVEGVDIGRAIGCCREHLLRGGGHPQAAGLTVAQDSIERFAAALAGQVGQMLDGRRPRPLLRYDQLVELRQVDETLVTQLQRLAPFGAGNPEPLLVARGLRLTGRRVLRGGHLHCVLEQDGCRRAAIGFGLAERAPGEGARVEAAFIPGWDRYHGDNTLRLHLKDVREEKES